MYHVRKYAAENYKDPVAVVGSRQEYTGSYTDGI